MVLSPNIKILDVVIIGAGIGGIGTAYNLQRGRPESNYVILESRTAIGGTWDVFKYPGIRSDSDLYTYSYPWHPWTGPPIADGALIRDYVRDAAAAQGIDRKILFDHGVTSVNWCPDMKLWKIETTGTTKELLARFIVFATGIYDLKTPLQPTVPGLRQFKGPIVNPQFWPDDLDYSGKKIAIIGSGATAVTLLPALAQRASHVTLLQRSPSYIINIPSRDLLSRLPSRVKRLIWIFFSQITYAFSQLFPRLMQWILYRWMQRAIPNNVDSDPHFRPRYYPWKQRICACPDGDFFTTLGQDNADITTDTIQTITDRGIHLDSGEFLQSDIIVTATGMRMQIAGGVEISVNEKECVLPEKFIWNGCMVQDVPNVFVVMGYPYIAWTLGVEVTAQRILKLLNHMDSHNFSVVVPRKDGYMGTRPLYNFESTYIKLGGALIPKMGDQYPWKPRTNFLADYLDVKWGALARDLEFS